jgi:hypothetical protein
MATPAARAASFKYLHANGKKKRTALRATSETKINLVSLDKIFRFSSGQDPSPSSINIFARDAHHHHQVLGMVRNPGEDVHHLFSKEKNMLDAHLHQEVKELTASRWWRL